MRQTGKLISIALCAIMVFSLTHAQTVSIERVAGPIVLSEPLYDSVNNLSLERGLFADVLVKDNTVWTTYQLAPDTTLSYGKSVWYKKFDRALNPKMGQTMGIDVFADSVTFDEDLGDHQITLMDDKFFIVALIKGKDSAAVMVYDTTFSTRLKGPVYIGDTATDQFLDMGIGNDGTHIYTQFYHVPDTSTIPGSWAAKIYKLDTALKVVNSNIVDPETGSFVTGTSVVFVPNGQMESTQDKLQIFSTNNDYNNNLIIGIHTFAADTGLQYISGSTQTIIEEDRDTYWPCGVSWNEKHQLWVVGYTKEIILDTFYVEELGPSYIKIFDPSWNLIETFSLDSGDYAFRVMTETVGDDIYVVYDEMSVTGNSLVSECKIEHFKITTTPDLYGGDDQTVCSGDSVTLSATSARGYAVDVTAPNLSDFDFAGDFPGADPGIQVSLGDTIVFNVNTPNHPFWLKTVPSTGTGNAISVSNNGTTSGTIVWVATAIGTIYYNCEIHAVMTGSITVSAPTNVFTWNNTVLDGVPFLPTATADYIVTATDTVGNTATDTVTITVLNADIQQNDTSICVGDSIQLSIIDSGNNYLWSTGDTTNSITVSPTANTTYTVTVDNGISTCSDSVTVFISDLSVVASGTNVTCNGYGDGTAAVAVSGGVGPYAYSWSTTDSSSSIDSLGAGTYTVAVSDSLGCTASDSAIVSEAPVLVHSTVGTDVSCYGGSDGGIDLTVSGGAAPYTFLWIPSNDSTEDVSGLGFGVHTYLVTDSNNCLVTDNIFIDQPLPIQATPTTTDVTCNGGTDGTATLVISGGTAPYTMDWGVMNPMALPAGSYIYTIIDSNACTFTDTVTIGEPAAIALSAMITDVSCNGDADGSIDLTISGGTAPYNYLWSNGDSTEDLSGLLAGAYTVLVTDSNGCQDSVGGITVTEPTALVLVMTATNVTCNGSADGTATVTVSGGVGPYAYKWITSATTSSITGLGPGTYTVKVTDSMGCTFKDSVLVEEAPALSDTAVATDVTCFGDSSGSIDLTVTGGAPPYTYLWGPNTDTIEDVSGLPFGVYTYLVIDSNLCLSTGNVLVNQPLPLLLGTFATDVTCSGVADGSITLAVTGGTAPYFILWDNGDTTENLTNLPAGTYNATVTDANGCQDSVSGITVAEPAALLLTSISTDASCYGASDGAIDLSIAGGTTPYSIIWSNSDTAQNLSGLVAGNYGVTVTDDNGCMDTSSMLIGEPAQVVTDVITGATQVFVGALETYSVTQTPGSAYTWIITGGTLNSGQGTNQATILWGNTPGSAQVAVVEIDADSCYGDTVYLVVNISDGGIGIENEVTQEELVMYPNPFNQTTKVMFSNEEKVPFKLVLYDMLGNKVRVMHDITANEVVVEKGNLAPGQYFIELQGKAKTFRGRLMVE